MNTEADSRSPRRISRIPNLTRRLAHPRAQTASTHAGAADDAEPTKVAEQITDQPRRIVKSDLWDAIHPCLPEISSHLARAHVTRSYPPCAYELEAVHCFVEPNGYNSPASQSA